MTNAFPSEVFLSLLDNSKYDMYTSRILSETEESAEVELAFTDWKNRYSDTILEEDALLEFVNRNGCHNAESTEDHDARLISVRTYEADPEGLRRAVVRIKKNAYKEKD
jgi:hypothetical protein